MTGPVWSQAERELGVRGIALERPAGIEATGNAVSSETIARLVV
jgi:hypothetical protein